MSTELENLNVSDNKAKSGESDIRGVSASTFQGNSDMNMWRHMSDPGSAATASLPRVSFEDSAQNNDPKGSDDETRPTQDIYTQIFLIQAQERRRERLQATRNW